MQTSSAHVALICLLAHTGGAWAHIPFPDAQPTPPRSRGTVTLAPYHSPALDPRLTFTNSPSRSVTQDRSPGPGASGKSSRAATERQASPKPRAERASTPLVAAQATAPGQAGYVHFFIIESPEGDTETAVGIELPDGRIAWSFPEIGVRVVPFIPSGEIEANGRLYNIWHLYGLRPFPDEQAMRALRASLWERVILWVDAETPYCNPGRPDSSCMSCLSFALQVLFPGRTPAYPKLPADFPSTVSGLFHTTDDLLLYVAGLHALPNRDARLARLNELTSSETLREDLVALVDAIDRNDRAEAARGSSRKGLSEKTPGARSYSRTPPQRKRI